MRASRALPAARGTVSLYLTDEASGRRVLVARKPNLLMYSWAHVVCRCVGLGQPEYKIGAMYVEYKNVASPSDSVAVPSFGRNEGLSYYNGLPVDQDFIRARLVSAPQLSIAPGFEAYFTAGVSGNRLTFSAKTSGSAGVLGRAFNDASNSKVFGVALVATPSSTDRSQDVVFARTYFDDSPSYPQQLKLAGSQIGIDWDVDFE